VLEPDLELTLRPVPKTEPVVLLAHEPDIANAVSHYPVDLQSSGHSKSGFVRGEPEIAPARKWSVVSELPNVCLGNSSPTIVPVAFLLVTLQRGGSRCLASQEMILRF
jgi:hypothetical protein